MLKSSILGHTRITAVVILVLMVAAAASGVAAYRLMASDFNDAQGEGYTWQSLRGKWVVINYFAEWCAPCLREIPELNAFYQQRADNTVLFGINYDPLSTDDLLALTRQYNIEFPVIDAESAEHLPMAPPQYLPATFIISPAGEVVKTLHGEQTAEGLAQSIQALQSL